MSRLQHFASPGNRLVLQIVLADRAKDIQRLDVRVARDGFVWYSAGDSPHLAGLDNLLFVADREGQFTFQQQSHLLVRMAVQFDDRVRSELDKRQHYFLAGGREDVDSGEDVVFRTVRAADDVF